MNWTFLLCLGCLSWLLPANTWAFQQQHDLIITSKPPHGTGIISRRDRFQLPAFSRGAQRSIISKTQHTTFNPLFPLSKRTTTSSSPLSSPSQRFVGPWDGDDIRWTQKWKRRLYRTSLSGSGAAPARSLLMVINLLMFVYQTANTVHLIRTRNPAYWPRDALAIISDTILGTATVRGPLTTTFIHNAILSRRQPYRFLTAGFLHGDILHLFLNLDALRRLPSWLETGLGTPLFVTTFLVSIVTGNIGHSMMNEGTRTFCLGASGGICGLYGLMYVALSKMGQIQKSRRVLKGILLVLASGFLWDNVSNAAHFGGFLGGVAVGILCAPHYSKSYSMRRKWSLEVDVWPKEYRQMMGFGISPTRRGLVPVAGLWAVAALVMSMEPRFRAIPGCIIRGLVNPGSLSLF